MAQTGIVVDTPSGKLRGALCRSSQGDDYFSFKGMPYAKPPVGPLRFQDPHYPVEPWTDVRDALEHGPTSAQWDVEAQVIKGAEDCLYLNVYSKGIKPNKPLPVMVWLHGGGFVWGSGNDDQFGPDFFMMKDVVLVTINYRLGVFGFLNLEDKAAPGNQGLKDQVAALHWVNTHISHFGGDPDNVTIFGGSAGSASVHYLAVSPLAKGLYHRAICQSGTIFCPWAVKRQPLKALREFLVLLGCEEKEPKRIVDYLKAIEYTKLIEAQGKMITDQTFIKALFPFGPTVDDKSDLPFLPVDPHIAAEAGVQVPLLVGLNNKEAIFLIEAVRRVGLEEIDQNVENYASSEFSNVFADFDLTINDLKKLYCKNGKLTEEQIVSLWTDFVFTYPIDRVLKIQADTSGAPTYFYNFSYENNVTSKQKTTNRTLKGASHGDELTYLFKMKVFEEAGLQQLQDGTGAEKLMKQMIELWVNFAKTGRPTLEKTDLIPTYWQPLDSDTVLRYLNIDEELRMKETLSYEKKNGLPKKVTKRTFI